MLVAIVVDAGTDRRLPALESMLVGRRFGGAHDWQHCTGTSRVSHILVTDTTTGSFFGGLGRSEGLSTVSSMACVTQSSSLEHALGIAEGSFTSAPSPQLQTQADPELGYTAIETCSSSTRTLGINY